MNKDKNKIKCWVKNNTCCCESSREMWLEKIEICENCDALKTDIGHEDLKELIKLTAKEFRDYKKKNSKERKDFNKIKKELEEFKISSVYLIKELNKNNLKVSSEKKYLDKILKDKSEKLSKIEKKYIQSAKLVTMGKFSAGIAHEINNPLGAVINYIRMVLANPKVTGEVKGYLELAFKGLFRIEKTIKDILNYSGDRKPNFAENNIKNLISESINLVQHRYNNKKIKIDINISDDDLTVYVDSHQVNEMFINLLNNAVDAIEREGRISIKVTSDADYVKIQIKDTGVGISEDNLDKIFDPFFTTKDVGKGSGMGLFVCFNIVNLNNGIIDIKSEKEKGTTVFISLPRKRKSIENV